MCDIIEIGLKLTHRLSILKNLASVLLWALLLSFIQHKALSLCWWIFLFVFSVFQFSWLVSQKVNLRHSF